MDGFVLGISTQHLGVGVASRAHGLAKRRNRGNRVESRKVALGLQFHRIGSDPLFFDISEITIPRKVILFARELLDATLNAGDLRVETLLGSSGLLHRSGGAFGCGRSGQKQQREGDFWPGTVHNGYFFEFN